LSNKKIIFCGGRYEIPLDACIHTALCSDTVSITAKESTMDHYGNGRSTGIDQTASGKIQTGFGPQDLPIGKKEKDTLKRLAERVRYIAESEKMAETKDLWRRHNDLEHTRPVVFCDPENGWNEIITESQMECEGKIARAWEMDLRKEIFWGEEMGDDKPIEAVFNVPYTVTEDDWGVETVFRRTNDLGSYVWNPPIQDYERDLEKLHSPRFEINWETTHGCLHFAHDLFDGILDIRLTGTWWWSLGVTMPAAFFRGLERMFYDFIDHPDEIRRLLGTISKGHLDKLDRLETEDLLSLNNDSTYVGSGGYGYTNELPQPDFDGMVRTMDMWGFTDSQETVHVSPQMYEEFVFPAEKPIMERFGLTCYGCCEPLHSRWHIVKRHKNLRRVSCSPWADIEMMARFLEDRYILSMKPSPSVISTPRIDPAALRKDIQRRLETTRGCIVEIIMKDNHTIGGRPENVVEWCRIAKDEAGRL
jgi:hypothetical protein